MGHKKNSKKCPLFETPAEADGRTTEAGDDDGDEEEEINADEEIDEEVELDNDGDYDESEDADSSEETEEAFTIFLDENNRVYDNQ